VSDRVQTGESRHFVAEGGGESGRLTKLECGKKEG